MCGHGQSLNVVVLYDITLPYRPAGKKRCRRSGPSAYRRDRREVKSGSDDQSSRASRMTAKEAGGIVREV